jgi:hypothetical protein
MGKGPTPRASMMNPGRRRKMNLTFSGARKFALETRPTEV